MAYTLADAKKRTMGHVGRAGAMITDTEVLQALNGAIDEVRTEMPYEAAPTITTTLVAATYDYDILALGFSLIHRITMSDADLTSFPTANILPSHYYFFVPMGHLVFDNNYWQPTAGRKLKIEGQKFQAQLVTDTDVIYISLAFLALQAAGSIIDSLGQAAQRAASLYRRAEETRQSHPYRAHAGARIVWGV